jgi:YHS domain-containing protein
MKKLVLLAGAALMLAPSAFAAPDKDKDKKAAPTEVHCAVMTDKTVNVKDATQKNMFADYKGKRYFFCCGGCPTAFKKDPKKFAKNDSIPTPKAEKPGKGKKS